MFTGLLWGCGSSSNKPAYFCKNLLINFICCMAHLKIYSSQYFLHANSPCVDNIYNMINACCYAFKSYNHTHILKYIYSKLENICFCINEQPIINIFKIILSTKTTYKITSWKSITLLPIIIKFNYHAHTVSVDPKNLNKNNQDHTYKNNRWELWLRLKARRRVIH